MSDPRSTGITASAVPTQASPQHAQALVPFEPADLGQAMQLSRELASSALIASALRQRPQDVLVIVLTGRDLGLTPMQSLRGIDVVEGKPRLSGDLVAALALRSPQCEYLEPVPGACDATRATYVAKRRGRPEQTLTYTLEEAKAAGLLDKGKDEWAKATNNWRRNPARMLDARCKYILAKKVFPEVLFGIYDPDEALLDDPAPPVAPGRAFLAPPPPAPAAPPPPVIDVTPPPTTAPVERVVGADDDEPSPVIPPPDERKLPPLEELLILLDEAQTKATGQSLVARAKRELRPEEIEQFRTAYSKWWKALPPEVATTERRS